MGRQIPLISPFTWGGNTSVISKNEYTMQLSLKEYLRLCLIININYCEGEPDMTNIKQMVNISLFT